MAPQPKVRQLVTWIEELPPEQRLELFRRTLTPEMRFCFGLPSPRSFEAGSA